MLLFLSALTSIFQGSALQLPGDVHASTPVGPLDIKGAITFDSVFPRKGEGTSSVVALWSSASLELEEKTFENSWIFVALFVLASISVLAALALVLSSCACKTGGKAKPAATAPQPDPRLVLRTPTKQSHPAGLASVQLLKTQTVGASMSRLTVPALPDSQTWTADVCEALGSPTLCVAALKRADLSGHGMRTIEFREREGGPLVAEITSTLDVRLRGSKKLGRLQLLGSGRYTLVTARGTTLMALSADLEARRFEMVALPEGRVLGRGERRAAKAAALPTSTLEVDVKSGLDAGLALICLLGIIVFSPPGKFGLPANGRH